MTLAASRLGASIVSKVGVGRGAGNVSSTGSSSRLAFRRVSAAEYTGVCVMCMCVADLLIFYDQGAEC
jgi:hypothetical protein